MRFESLNFRKRTNKLCNILYKLLLICFKNVIVIHALELNLIILISKLLESFGHSVCSLKPVGLYLDIYLIGLCSLILPENSATSIKR